MKPNQISTRCRIVVSNFFDSMDPFEDLLILWPPTQQPPFLLESKQIKIDIFVLAQVDDIFFHRLYFPYR